MEVFISWSGVKSKAVADALGKPWLNFEAGALSKRLDTSRVIPLAIDLAVADIKQPLGQFQAQEADETGVRRIVESINETTDEPLSESNLEASFNQGWPTLEAQLDEIKVTSVRETTAVPSDRELLAEILDTVRGIARSDVRLHPDEAMAVLTEALPDSTILSHTAGTNRIAVSTEAPIVGEAQTPFRQIAATRGFALDFHHRSDA